MCIAHSIDALFDSEGKMRQRQFFNAQKLFNALAIQIFANIIIFITIHSDTWENSVCHLFQKLFKV